MRTISYFPGMPKLTFIVKSRLKEQLPDTKLSILEDPQHLLKNVNDYKAYQVYIDEQNIGRFTIRKAGTLIERNFFCYLPAETNIPPTAIEQGVFGTGSPWYYDPIRILLEHLTVIVFHTLAKRFGWSNVAKTYDPGGGLTEPKSITGLNSLLKMFGATDNIQFSQKQCDEDMVKFALPSQMIELVLADGSHPSQMFEIDIGGYCPQCLKYLCPKHIKFKEKPYPDQLTSLNVHNWALSCRKCSSLLTKGGFTLSSVISRVEKLESKQSISPDEMAELQRLKNLLNLAKLIDRSADESFPHQTK